MRAPTRLCRALILGAALTVVAGCSSSTKPSGFPMGGTLSGLPANTSVTLLLNGGDALTLSADGSFTFQQKLQGGTSYTVTVGTQPTGAVCTLTNPSGTVSGPCMISETWSSLRARAPPG